MPGAERHGARACAVKEVRVMTGLPLVLLCHLPHGRLSVGVEFDGPFARRLERNTFRSVLIDYQRDRRQLIQYEDEVYRTLRALLRQLAELETNLEIQRRAVAIAIRRVDQTREVLNEPPEGENTELGPTASLNLISALSDLRSAQDNFMSVWLNYLAGGLLVFVAVASYVRLQAVVPALLALAVLIVGPGEDLLNRYLVLPGVDPATMLALVDQGTSLAFVVLLIVGALSSIRDHEQPGAAGRVA